MRHVQEVFHQPKPRRAHRHPAAGNIASILLVGLGNVDDILHRLAQRREQAAIFHLHGQGRAAALIGQDFPHHETTAFAGEILDLLAQQLRQHGPRGDLTGCRNGIPVVQNRLVGGFCHASTSLCVHCLVPPPFSASHAARRAK